MTSSATRGASAASFSPRFRQSAAAAPKAIACQLTGGLGGTAPASSHFPMVSESGRTGSAPTVNGTPKSRRLPPGPGGYGRVDPPVRGRGCGGVLPQGGAGGMGPPGGGGGG